MILLAFASMLCEEAPETPDYSIPTETRYISAPSGLRVRSAPDREAAVLGLIPFNAPVQVVARAPEELTIDGKTGNWVEVKWQNLRGWVFEGYLGLEPASRVEMQSTEIFPGRWLASSTCADGMSYIEIHADRTFDGQFFGGCDISGCICGTVGGSWVVDDDRICFSIKASETQVLTDSDRASCYTLYDSDMLKAGTENPFRENFGSEVVTELRRDADRSQ
ncbi:MAG: SH3 domain-containing protein [Leptospiraceae bacterium]|nr:SH3 domain-containing protein [Leptospiraceae bacterium]